MASIDGGGYPTATTMEDALALATAAINKMMDGSLPIANARAVLDTLARFSDLAVLDRFDEVEAALGIATANKIGGGKRLTERGDELPDWMLGPGDKPTDHPQVELDLYRLLPTWMRPSQPEPAETAKPKRKKKS